ncbi:MAG: hypothetical protein NTU58_04340 [Candidatus Nealsonbacteria bacterium]|nr:hypothetical protein [Candidatus Nealsonbacteria bacterium]
MDSVLLFLYAVILITGVELSVFLWTKIREEKINRRTKEGMIVKVFPGLFIIALGNYMILFLIIIFPLRIDLAEVFFIIGMILFFAGAIRLSIGVKNFLISK